MFPGIVLMTKIVSRLTEVAVSARDNSEKVTKHVLPPGCRTYLNIPATHLNEQWWPSAEKIIPERWIPTSSEFSRTCQRRQEYADQPKTNHRKQNMTEQTRTGGGAFMNFSDGSRPCLGRKFAQAEILAFFVVLLRWHSIQIPPGADKNLIERKVNMRSAGTLTLSLEDDIPLELVRVQSS